MEVGILIGISFVLCQLFQWCNGWQKMSEEKNLTERKNDKSGFIYHTVGSQLSFFSREQYVVNGAKSSVLPVVSGIPHGSVHLALCCF